MSEVLTIGAFLHDLNLPGIKKEAEAFEALKTEIHSSLFESQRVPDLKKFTMKYSNEKFIQKVVHDALKFYFETFKTYILKDYALRFKAAIQGTANRLFWIILNFSIPQC